MGIYSRTLSENAVRSSDILNLSLNISILSVFYAFIGAFVSIIFYYIFDEFDEAWKGKGQVYQIYDIGVEISLLALVAFWTVHIINTSAPIFPVRSEMAPLVDAYTSGMFFIYAVFLFMDDLSNKIKYVYEQSLGKRFDKLFPSDGSILDFSLRYSD